MINYEGVTRKGAGVGPKRKATTMKRRAGVFREVTINVARKSCVEMWPVGKRIALARASLIIFNLI